MKIEENKPNPPIAKKVASPKLLNKITKKIRSPKKLFL
jgi:hypothetical protein